MTTNRLRVLAGAAAFAFTAALAAAASAQDWTAAPDVAKAKEQAAQGMITYGLPDDWANYGESLQQFCSHHQFPSCQHTDTDMSSNEEITRYDAEKSKPAAIFSDIGIAFGSVAEKREVVPPYLPPNAQHLPAGWKASTAAGSPPSSACPPSSSTRTWSRTCRNPGTTS